MIPPRVSFGVENADGMAGECKDVMNKYLACIKRVKGKNDEECRGIAKTYLGCRMDRYVERVCESEFTSLRAFH
jgi:cytochrome c oxidase assembly protein subunit 19